MISTIPSQTLAPLAAAGMNYLAHAHRLLLDTPQPDPYEIAGLGLPDWLSVVDRRVRVRTPAASAWLTDTDPHFAGLARGVIRHHQDDAWFHETPAFRQLNVQFAVRLRESSPDPTGMRSGFVAHLLVEVLLDASLDQRHPGLLERYYQILHQIDAQRVQEWVDRTAKVSSPRIREIVPRMIAERFLADYVDDRKLLLRLNQVMRRVRLPELPDETMELFPEAREAVERHHDQLLGADRPTTSPSEA